MTDFSSLQIKVNDLKAKVAQNSITPAYLGALLDDFIVLMKNIDMTDMTDDVRTALNNANTAIQRAQLAIDRADSAFGNADTAISMITLLSNSLGASGGIATLGDDGRVPLSQLPVGELKDVVEFDGMVMLAFAPAIEQGSATGEGEVLFLASTGTFAFRASGMSAKYYANWGEAEAYGEFSDRGRVPSGGKLYLDVSTNTQYRWDGETLEATGSHLELGETAGTAYAGDKGEKLRADVEALAKDVDRVAEQLQVIVFDGIITDEQDLDSLPAGFYFHAGQNRFGYSEGAAQSWDPDDGHTGNSAEDRASCLFRCGVRLFHFVDDSMFEFVDSETLDSKVSTAVGVEKTARMAAINNLNTRCNALAKTARHIMPFAGILATEADVLATNQHKAYFCKETGHFLDGMGDPSSQEVNELEDGLAKGTSVFMHASRFYVYNDDTETLEMLVTAPEAQALADEARMAVFVDMWNARCIRCSSTNPVTIARNTFGRYNDDTGFFELNGLTDITYEQAIEIMKLPDIRANNSSNIPNIQLGFSRARTTFPVMGGTSTSRYATLMHMPNLEVTRIVDYYIVNNGGDPDTYPQKVNNTREMFYMTPKLRELQGVMCLDSGDAQGVHFYNCIAPALETIWLQNVCLDITSFQRCPNLRIECIAYMVEHAAGTKAISIALHPDVYARLTDEIIEAAAAKQISFITK